MSATSQGLRMASDPAFGGTLSAGLAQPLSEVGCPRQSEPGGRSKDTLRTVGYSPDRERFLVEHSGDQVMPCRGNGTRRTLAFARRGGVRGTRSRI